MKILSKGTELKKGDVVKIYRNSITATFIEVKDGLVWMDVVGTGYDANQTGISSYNLNSHYEILDPITYLKNNQ